jgi:hypothetical protein
MRIIQPVVLAVHAIAAAAHRDGQQRFWPIILRIIAPERHSSVVSYIERLFNVY